MSWTVPRIWAGQTVAILASGPSMSPEVVADLGDLPCIAINSTFRLAPRAAILYAADRGWWRHPTNADHLHFRGIRLTVTRDSDAPAPPGVLELRSTGVVGFDPDPGCIRTGGNSAYQALHVAIHAGAERVLLAGLDMSLGHWHPEHPADLMQTCEIALARWKERFEALAGILAERGGPEVINVTPGSQLRAFPITSISRARALAAA